MDTKIELLVYAADYARDHGRAPTIATVVEWARLCGLELPHYHLGGLMAQGRIAVEAGRVVVLALVVDRSRPGETQQGEVVAPAISRVAHGEEGTPPLVAPLLAVSPRLSGDAS